MVSAETRKCGAGVGIKRAKRTREIRRSCTKRGRFVWVSTASRKLWVAGARYRICILYSATENKQSRGRRIRSTLFRGHQPPHSCLLPNAPSPPRAPTPAIGQSWHQATCLLSLFPPGGGQSFYVSCLLVRLGNYKVNEQKGKPVSWKSRAGWVLGS